MLARLDIGVVIPGHGEPFTDVGRALERAFARLAAFEADPLRAARHTMKALFTFKLLDRQRIPIATLPDYIERVEAFRDFNARYFRLSTAQFAAWLVADLERLGAIRRDGGNLVPG
jgi:hypothetical protein